MSDAFFDEHYVCMLATRSFVQSAVGSLCEVVHKVFVFGVAEPHERLRRTCSLASRYNVIALQIDCIGNPIELEHPL